MPSPMHLIESPRQISTCFFQVTVHGNLLSEPGNSTGIILIQIAAKPDKPSLVI